MKKLFGVLGILLCLFILTGNSSFNKELWKSREAFYKINQSQVGDYQDKKEDWKNSTTFINIFIELEDKYNAFICSTWNYDIIDGKSRYEASEHGDIPIEYDYYGYSFIVSENYFDYTVLKDVNGTYIPELLTNNENTLDILVAEKYKNDAPLITSIYQEYMYFNNVEVENIYNEELNKKINNKKETDFSINIIFVPNDTEYDIYNPAIEKNKIQDSIAIVINSENYNRVQLNSIANQGLYIHSNADSTDIENIIKSVYEKNKYEDGYHSIESVKDLYDEYEKDKITEFIVIGFLCTIGVLVVITIMIFVRKKIRKSNEK